MRVVQVGSLYQLGNHYINLLLFEKVWFQNRRAKEKRLKKDAHGSHVGKSHHPSHQSLGHSVSGANRWSNTNSSNLSIDGMPHSNASSAILANETSTSCSSWFDDAVIDDSDDDESVITQQY